MAATDRTRPAPCRLVVYSTELLCRDGAEAAVLDTVCAALDGVYEAMKDEGLLAILGGETRISDPYDATEGLRPEGWGERGCDGG